METDIYARWRGKSPTRRCPKCGQSLPIESFRVVYPKSKAPQLYYACRECERVRERKRKQAVARGQIQQKPRTSSGPLPSERNPIPELEVGRQYTIIDIGRTWQGVPGGDGNAKPITYSGPCVARWGRNWGIQTNTGIRCFTPGQLVGLTVREVA